MDKLRRILSKIFFCDEDSVECVLIHIPVGLVTVGIALYSIGLAVLFAVGFIIYELNEGKIIEDKPFRDIQGWLWGLGLLSIPLLIVKLWT